MSRIRVKICGITNLDDALIAARLGADALGFIFYSESPRKVDPVDARRIICALPPFISRVGVFVGVSPAEAARRGDELGLSYLQLHSPAPGEAPPHWRKRIIPAYRVTGPEVLEEIAREAPPFFLMDTASKEKHGGTGKSFSWELAREAGRFGRVILAGGLSPLNVREAVAVGEPYAVDVASGVEAEPGRKDPVLLKEFMEAINPGTAGAPIVGGGNAAAG